MKVAVVHNAIAPGEKDQATLDVVEQAEHVAASLRAAGHAGRLFPLDRDAAKTLRKLKLYRPDCIFNLVESVAGHAVLHPCAAALWELIGVPHTGSPSWALDHTTDKALAKTLLADAGIATAEWAICRQLSDGWRRVPGPWILKPAMEDASIGIDEDSVVRDPAAVAGQAARPQEPVPEPGRPRRAVRGRARVQHLAAGGRARRAGAAAGGDDLHGLSARQGARARIPGEVGAEAFEYEHTGRRFDFPPEESGLIEQMKQIAKRCWALFDLHGYARVDVRVDADSRIFVLEINANPCLTPDAGFAAAVARAGISPAQMVQRILEDPVCVPPLPR